MTDAQVNREKDFEPHALPEGTLLSVTNYYTVVSKDGSALTIRDKRGEMFMVGNNVIKAECVPCTTGQYTEKVTRTRMAELLQNAGQRAFIVKFTVKPDAKDGVEAIETEWSSANTATKKRKIVNEKVLTGKERTLRGYLHSTEHLMGRAQVVDLDEEMQGRFPLRQVDYRTLTELSIGNVCYTLK